MRHVHRVGFFVCPGYWMLDLAGPLGVFEAASANLGARCYDTRVLSEAGGAILGGASLRLETRRSAGARIDTVLFVGGEIAPMLEPGAVAAAKAMTRRASRLGSVCSGAFLLAGTGALDGRRATTHWRCARQLAERHPAVTVDADRIFIEDGPVWTAAGMTAGIDLALALVEADHGSELARAVARDLVVHHRRPGGQSQFSEMSDLDPESDRMRRALTFAREHLHEPLPVERLAHAARLSMRQFGRAFHRETGETPARAVERLRVEAARLRLRDGSEPVEHIARAVGFVDPERMRRAFVKLHGMSPQAVRRIARAPR